MPITTLKVEVWEKTLYPTEEKITIPSEETMYMSVQETLKIYMIKNVLYGKQLKKKGPN